MNYKLIFNFSQGEFGHLKVRLCNIQVPLCVVTMNINKVNMSVADMSSSEDLLI